MTTPQATAPELGQSQQQDGPRQLRRSRRDRVVGGVCGGLGQYFGIDPIVLRIAFVALTLAGGSGVLLYIIAWIFIPEAEWDEQAPTPPPRAFAAPQAVIGAALAFIGALLLADQLLPGIDEFVWPLLLVTVGVAILIRGEQR